DSVITHFDGTSWTIPVFDSDKSLIQGSPGVSSVVNPGLWVRGPREVYIGARDGRIGRFDGTGWNDMKSSAPFARPIIAISGPPGGCAMALAFTEFESLQPVLQRGVGPSGCLSSPFVPPTTWP